MSGTVPPSLIALAPLAAGLSLAALTAAIAKRAAAEVPPLGRFIDLPDARLHVVDRCPLTPGRAPTIMLLHGLGGQLRHFSYRLIESLAPSYRVIAFDRPGSGYSSWRAGVKPSLAAQADLVEALAAHLQIERVVLVGHSLGGAIALGAALRQPGGWGGPATWCRRFGSPTGSGVCWHGPWPFQLLACSANAGSPIFSRRTLCRLISPRRAEARWCCVRHMYSRRRAI
jgi:pimeloyl-ACP methyl ester carboxylesterase